MINPFKPHQYHPNGGKQCKIKPAFKIGLTQWYTFDNLLDMSIDRAMLYQQLAREFDMKIDSDYISQHVEAVIKCINKGDLSKVAVLTNHLKQRTEALTERETMYRLASIIYFPYSEDISEANYDMVLDKCEQLKKKGEKWLVSTPFRDFLPPALSSPGSLSTYLTASQIGIQADLALISSWNNKKD